MTAKNERKLTQKMEQKKRDLERQQARGQKNLERRGR